MRVTYSLTTGTANIALEEVSISLQLFELFINVTCGFTSFNLLHLTYEIPFLLANKHKILTAACQNGEYL
jgi:hypothetical protein